MLLRICLIVILLLAAAQVWAQPAKSDGAPPTGELDTAGFESTVRPFVEHYCADCHGDLEPRAELNLLGFTDAAAALDADAGRQVWHKVLGHLRRRAMPPADAEQPPQSEIDAVTAWIDAELTRVQCAGPRDPGRVTIRRLNRTEYNNTTRDLVNIDFRPADDFPSDEVGYGFDHIGDVLSLPPVLLEKYLDAAEQIMDRAIDVHDSLEVQGPLDVRREPPASHGRIIFRQPDGDNRRECAREIIERFASRAFRRQATGEEVERLLLLADMAEREGEPFERQIQFALTAVLVSPHFLFRVELDPPADGEDVHPLNDYELATRLSYFLWSSMPDDELFRLAGKGVLHKPGVLRGQARRMLRDPKASALVDGFSSQWLEIRRLSLMTPDKSRFPDFDEPLRAAMLEECTRFFAAVVDEDRGVLELIDADFTFLNERLARHYGIEGVSGPEFRRVALTDRRRGGVLTQASVLCVTSNPTRTSPVKRGKWILEEILGTPPAAPPPGVEELKDEEHGMLTGTLRQRMEQHRVNPTCASCHSRMDPLGFGLENFDAIGAWRTAEGQFDIDVSGELPDGSRFNGPAELKRILLARKDDFARSFTEKMLTYALGRGLEFSDRCTVDDIAGELANDNYRFSSLILNIVASRAFQYRRAVSRD